MTLSEPRAVPCKVYFERKDGTLREITAKTPEELDALKRIGWKEAKEK